MNNIDFLQSNEWKNFQSATGRKTLNIKGENFWTNIIEHELPIVGKYFYIPRGNIFEIKDKNVKNYLDNLFYLAKGEKVGWIRIEPLSNEILELTKKNIDSPIIKAPHDMQPKEIFVIDITKPEEQLLAEMKPKTRYNIKVAQKHNILVKIAPSSKKYTDEFLRLIKIMAKRQNIKTHSDEYYRKMFETIPNDILKLYIAEYKNEIIAANIMIFYDKTAIYLHGASDDKYKNLMAPHMLQWQAIKDAKKMGCEKYDFGGIKTRSYPNHLLYKERGNSWQGITRFKLSFSPNTKPVEFPGSYDIVINKNKYFLYRAVQKIKNII